MQLPKFLMSSINPEQVGLTVKGALVAIIPVVLILAGVAHWNLGQEQLTEIVDLIASIAVAFSTAISGVMILLGLVRKLFVAIGLLKPVA